MKSVLQKRTKAIALRVIRLCQTLQKDPTARVIARQLLRSATSVGANYRAACRAKSTADFIHKLKIVEEETDETLYWLEILIEANFVDRNKLAPLIDFITKSF